jgi:UDP-glucuronate 4-epimerase
MSHPLSILVTGGAGFIGSHFIEALLAAGAAGRIICLDDFNDSYDPDLKRANLARLAGDDRVVVAEQSALDTVAVRALLSEFGVRQIVHLAGRAGVRASFTQSRRYQRDNVGGTLSLLEAARGAQIERFVLVSSSTVYGADAGVPFAEDAPLGRPLSPYGVTKRAAERLGEHYRQAHGVPVVRLRPFSVYGPRMRPDLAMRAFAERILARKRLTLFGDGTIRRDFTHVSDICRGLASSLTAEGVIGQAINLGHQEPVAIAQLIRWLEGELGVEAIIDRQPGFAGDLPLTCADLAKARRLLAYEPTVSLADGVRDFVAWLRGSQAD